MRKHIHKLSVPAFGMLKYGLFLVVVMLVCPIFYINTPMSTEEYVFCALPTARLMVEGCLTILLIVLIAAFFIDAAGKNE